MAFKIYDYSNLKPQAYLNVLSAFDFDGYKLHYTGKNANKLKLTSNDFVPNQTVPFNGLYNLKIVEYDALYKWAQLHCFDVNSHFRFTHESLIPIYLNDSLVAKFENLEALFVYNQNDLPIIVSYLQNNFKTKPISNVTMSEYVNKIIEIIQSDKARFAGAILLSHLSDPAYTNNLFKKG